MIDTLVQTGWTALLEKVDRSDRIDLSDVLGSFGELISADIAWAVIEGEVREAVGLPDGHDQETLLAPQSSDSDQWLLFDDHLHYLARSEMELARGTLMVARAAREFSEQEREVVSAFGHVLDLALMDAPRRSSRSTPAIDEVFGRSDTLTGLMTRDSFKVHLDRQLASGNSAAMVVIGLDGFRIVNETLGHAAGDLVLQTVAARIQTSVRDGDIAARVGGDVFAIYSPGIGPDLAADVATRIQDAIGHGISVGESDLGITSSVGVSTNGPGEDADDMIATADTAMRDAKATGPGRVHVYDDELRNTTMQRRSMAGELQDAISNNQLATLLEPIVAMSDLAIVGREAKIRWQHPVRGLLEPQQFMRLAEDIGRASDVERAVFTFALNEYFHGVDLPPTSINISAASLLDRRHIEWMIEQLDSTGENARKLIVEVGEEALLTSPVRSQEHLDILREHGVGIMLDDFGLSSASLRTPHTFSFDGIKLHPALTEDLDEESVLSMLRALYASSDSLGYEIIHIGIDTEHGLISLAENLDRLGRPEFYAQGRVIFDRVACL